MVGRLAFRALGIAVVAVVLSLGSPRAVADYHDGVRRAVLQGEIRPLSEILNSIAGRLPGAITGVEIDRRHGRWLYEFRVVDPKGRLFEVHVNARTSEIEQIREK